MIPLPARAGQTVALFGLGDSGMAAARSLIAGGADVTAFDDNSGRVDVARRRGIVTADLRDADWRNFDALVLAPGVPLTHPEPHWSVGLAHGAGVPVIGDIALLGEAIVKSGTCARLIAITGTNGKSTTTALIGHVLKEAGCDVAVGGNIGTPVLELDPPRNGLHYVVECSSYQIDLAPGLTPDVGILLNLTPDHLDRHGTMAHYAAVKERLVSASGTAIIGVDDEWCEAIAARREDSAGSVIRLSVASSANANFRLKEADIDLAGERIASLAGVPTLLGKHNAQNALAAAAAACSLGLDNREIQMGLSSFRGLAHRMQPVGRVGPVLFVNDSKATNADAAAHALSSFDDIFWIAGGRAKDGGFDSLNKFFPRIRKAYLIGEAAEVISAILGTVPNTVCETLDRAVAEAARDAGQSGLENAVVLFSPACASFDQFANFELRGNAFVGQAGALAGFEES